MNSKMILSENRKTYMDFWISYIAFIFDFNFTAGLKHIRKMNYINRIIDRLDYKNIDTKEKMEKIRKHANKYVKFKLENE